MGKPKFSRKKYETPSHPWQEDRIKAENELVKKYGLKNKREIWKAQTRLRKYRGQARELLAKVRGGEVQSKTESDQLLMHLSRMNILPPNSTLDDVLTLETESILSRRLQTLTYLKGLASTPDQARQLISHGHIAIDNRRVTVPGYMVTKNEESEISYMSDSSLNDVMHPARPRGDFKSVPVKKDTRPEGKAKEEKTEEKPAEPAGETKDETPTEEKPTEEPPVEEPPKEEEKPTEPEDKPAEPEQKEETTEPEPSEETPAEPSTEEPADEPPREEENKEEKPTEKPSEDKPAEETPSEPEQKKEEAEKTEEKPPEDKKKETEEKSKEVKEGGN